MDKKHIHEMLEKMSEWSLSEMQSKGKEHVDTEEMGKAIDMVKDLAEAEMSVWKACYYKSIVEAMEKSEKEDELMLKMMIEEHGEAEGRMGYDRWRNSKGRFADKGHGHETSMRMATGRAGFMPDDRLGDYYDDPRMWREPWASAMGYSRDSSGRDGGRTSSSSSESSHTIGRMGYIPEDDPNYTGKGAHYDEYTKARRHFQETGDQSSKKMMTDHGREYVGEAIMTMRDIFAEADPDLQKKIKDDVFRIYREFGGK